MAPLARFGRLAAPIGCGLRPQFLRILLLTGHPRRPFMKLQTYSRPRQFNARSSIAEREIRDCVRTLLASHFGHAYATDRRRERRFPFPHLVLLTPLADDGRTPAGPAMVAVGRELSEGGFGFFHPSPLHYRQMITSIEGADNRWFHLVIDLTWCRFMRHGWYESGGRFLRTIAIDQPSIVRAPSLPEYQI